MTEKREKMPTIGDATEVVKETNDEDTHVEGNSEELNDNETPAEEAQVEESNDNETPAEEVQVEESNDNETPAEEVQVEESNDNETPAVEAQVEVSNDNETPAEEVQVEESTDDQEKREEMPKPNIVADKQEMPPPTDNLTSQIQSQPAVRWVESVAAKLPKVNYPISLEELSNIVKDVYIKHAVQPSYVVKDTKPGAWIIDGEPKNNVRLSLKEFAPNIHSDKMRKRMYTKATFARRHLLINSVLGVVIENILKEKDCKGITSSLGNVRGKEVVLGMLPQQSLAVTLMWDGGATSLDPMAGMRMGVWLYKAGGGWLEVDATADAPVQLHEEPGKQHMGPKLVLEQTHMAMRRVNEQHILSAIVDDIGAQIDVFNTEKKKQAKKLREKRRKRKKR